MRTYSEQYPLIVKKVHALFSEQTCLSYAVPAVINGVSVEKYFLYSMTNTLERGRPWGLLTVSMETGEILAYQNCHFSDFMKTEDFPFSVPVSYALPRKTGIKEFKLQQNLQQKLYENVRKMAFKETLSMEERGLLRQYLIVLETMIPVSLVPYYQEMGAEFFEWGNNHV